MANIPQVGGSHYKVMKIQPWDYIIANNLTWHEGEIVKYVTRWKSKNGVEDLLKAKSVIEHLILQTMGLEPESANQTPPKPAQKPVVEYHLTENEYMGID